MAGLLTPLIPKRRRTGIDKISEILASEETEIGPRRYRWVTGREGIFSEPIALLLGLLIREAVQEKVSEVIIAPGGFDTRVVFREQEAERLRLRRFHAPLLTQRLRDLCGLPAARGYYPQQGSFTLLRSKARYGVQVTITQTPWGEQSVLTIAVAP